MTDTRNPSLPIDASGEACCGDGCRAPAAGVAATTDLREEVRARYADFANAANDGGCCTSEEEAEIFGAALYAADLDAVPDVAVEASLGCGNPTAVAELR